MDFRQGNTVVLLGHPKLSQAQRFRVKHQLPHPNFEVCKDDAIISFHRIPVD